MTRFFQLVLLATALMTALAGPASSLIADGPGPWPDPPNVNLVNS
jgi:hypothetical protein